MDSGLLYETPFSDLAQTGPEAIFTELTVRKIVDLIRDVDLSATA